jgi:AraC family transcriptional regulator
MRTYQRGGFPAHIIGSHRAGPLTVIETRYPAGTTLPRHAHERGCLIAVLTGTFDDVVGRSIRRYGRSSFFYRAPGERHANRFDNTVRCANIEVDSDRDLSSRTIEDHSLIDALQRELAAADDLSPLSIEHIVNEVLESLGHSARGSHASPRVARARELADDAFSTPLSLSFAAGTVGLHPAKLARDFRRAYGCTFGEYVRRRRVEYAADALREQARSLAEISVAAGFYDQSHFTNAFRRIIGVTPARFRRG